MGKHYYYHHIWSQILSFDCKVRIWPWLFLTVKVKVMHILTVDISQTEKYDRDCYCQQIWSRKCLLDLHIYIWPWYLLKIKVKVMHIFAVSISQTMTYIVSIAVANKCEVVHTAFWAVYVNLIFTFSKDQCHDHAHLDCEYRANRGRWGKHYYHQQIESHSKTV